MCLPNFSKTRFGYRWIDAIYTFAFGRIQERRFEKTRQALFTSVGGGDPELGKEIFRHVIGNRCPLCQGVGWIRNEKCALCIGTGGQS